MSKQDFKPYVSPDKNLSEFTVRSVILGVILAIVFGAANAYLGLKVGMTISASIPAAVISMGFYRTIRRKNSILESNMVQTIGSAGESLAGGAVFTMPVLFLWAQEGVMPSPSLIMLSLIAVLGGVLGTIFMIPLRKPLIVDEHETLPYPEGTACAQVLLAGEETGASSKSIMLGIGISAFIKFIIDGLKIIPEQISLKLDYLKTSVSVSAYPALFSVGYIVGPKVSSTLFAGTVLSWLVLIPAISIFGWDSIISPATDSIATLYATGGADAIWGSYIRYIGAGAVATAGIINLIKSLPMIAKAFATSVRSFRRTNGNRSDSSVESTDRTQRDLSLAVIGAGLLISFLIIWLIPAIPINIFGVIIVFVFSFFFATVSSKVVGMVGSSNSPVSGMAIATLLISTLLMKVSGVSAKEGMLSSIAIGSIVCIVAAMAADTSQDLKTGFILGATPKKQQIGELIGSLFSAIAIGGVLILLDKAWGFGTASLPAPQANLMKVIIEGVMAGRLPWNLLAIGAFLAVVCELLGVSSLSVAIGIYLPITTIFPTFIGGAIRYFIDKKRTSDDADDAVMLCSGLIAGEGLAGIVLAILVVTGISEVLDMSGICNLGWLGTLAVILSLVALIVRLGTKRRK